MRCRGLPLGRVLGCYEIAKDVQRMHPPRRPNMGFLQGSEGVVACTWCPPREQVCLFSEWRLHRGLGCDEYKE